MVNVDVAREKFGGEPFSFPDSVKVSLADPRKGPGADIIAGCVLTESCVIFFDTEMGEVLRVARSAITDARKTIPVGYSGMSSLEISTNSLLKLEFNETQGYTGYTSADKAMEFHGWLRKKGIFQG